MVKPHGKIERLGYKPGVIGIPIAPEGIYLAAWCPDKYAKQPPEQVHMEIHVQGMNMPLVMRFKSPDTLGFIIEELSRYRSLVWPDAEPVESIPNSMTNRGLLSSRKLLCNACHNF